MAKATTANASPEGSAGNLIGLRKISETLSIIPPVDKFLLEKLGLVCKHRLRELTRVCQGAVKKL
jgi:hypothetical protein